MIGNQWARPTSSDRARRRAARLACALVAGASLAGAAPAGAATLSADYAHGVLTYQAGVGESNEVKIDTSNGGYRVEDSNASALAFSQLGGSLACSTLDMTRIRCPQAGLRQAAIALGDGADSLDASGVSLPVSVDGGAGGKTIELGDGDDTVSVRNGSLDRISCGAGDDTVVGDPQDKVASDCEHVDLGVLLPTATGGHGVADPGPSAGSGHDDGALTAPIGVVLPPHPVEMAAPDRAVVSVSCAPGTTGGCHGDITLELPSSAHASASAQRVIAARGHFLAQQHRRLGRGRFRLRSGQSKKVAVRIVLRGHYTLFVHHRTRRAQLRVVERDSAGKVVGAETRSVTLKAARNNKWSRLRRNHR